MLLLLCSYYNAIIILLQFFYFIIILLLLCYFFFPKKKDNQKKSKNISPERVEVSACRANDTLKHPPHIYLVHLTILIALRFMFKTIFPLRFISDSKTKSYIWCTIHSTSYFSAAISFHRWEKSSDAAVHSSAL